MSRSMNVSSPSLRVVFSAWLLGAAATGLGAQMAPPAAISDAQATLHMLSRATWGVRPGDLEAALDFGRENWLQRQLHPEQIDESALESRLATFDGLNMSMAEMAAFYQPQQQILRQMQSSMGSAEPGMQPDGQLSLQDLTPEQRRAVQQRSPGRLLNELVSSSLTRVVHAERQLEEVMTDFWFNHFNVFYGNNQVRNSVDDYLNEAIRPNVFGRFEDMLLATARHPAMLAYLDNATSVVPDSMRDIPVAQDRALDRLRQMTPAQREQAIRSGRITRAQAQQLERLGQMGPVPPAQRLQGRGMNENYARELLELHTLGVDGGYTQQDVIEVARAFTGWTFVPLRQGPNAQGRVAPVALGEPGAFLFNAVGHDRREKTVLGQRLPAGRGVEDGEDVIRMLAWQPSTARFLATKLVERFVSDVPDQEFVEELAQVYLRTDGDLREVTEALFSSARFYAPEVLGAKVKTPFELVASALRVVGAEASLFPRTTQTLRTMGHLPFNEPAPTGFPAMNEDWVNSGAMLARMNFGLDLAAGRVDGVRVDPLRFAPGNRLGTPEMAVDGVLASILPGQDTERLAAVLLEEFQKADGPARARYQRVLGLALGSPEFQRR